MHYTFDIISCIFFIACLIVLRGQKWRFTKRYRAIYGLTALTAVYLVCSLYFCFSWHTRTGLEIVQPFYAYDTLYFVTLSLILGFLALYFTDTCLPAYRHAPWIVLPVPVLIAVYFIAFNKKTGWMFTYVDGAYRRGPYLWINYLVWIVYGLAIVLILYRGRIKLGQRTSRGLALFLFYEFALQVYQFFFVNIYVGGLAYSAGLLYLIVSPIFLEPQYDDLTGIYNRQGFFVVVRDMIRRSASKQLQIVAVDISRFGDINEQYDFEAGNRVLKKVAGELKRLFPGAEAIARFDADHFFVCAYGKDIALPIPEIEVGDCILDGGSGYEVSLYEGVYSITDTGLSISRMCDRAAFAAGQVSTDYNRRFAYFDASLEERMQFQTYIRNEMKHALMEDRFLVFYQPIFDVKTLRMVGAEALVRWRDKRYGMISPGDFISQFEKSGFVTDLDFYVTRQVCRQMVQWKKEGRRPISISVNASRVDVLSNSFAERFNEMVEGYGLSPEDVRVEVTESAFIQAERITERLEQLHNMGYRILMDDFGSGYSNFNTFANMPVDILKVDMGFMTSMEKSERGRRIFESIADMSHRISMPIIAEGVETQEQLSQLRSLGIEYAQGFYLAKPVSAEELERYFTA